MGSYPIRYRGPRSPQRGGRIPYAPDLPPFDIGPWAGITMAAWAFGNLASEIYQGWDPHYSPATPWTQDPSTKGWMLEISCGPRGPRRLGGFVGCGSSTLSPAAYFPNGLNKWNRSGPVYLWGYATGVNILTGFFTGVPRWQKWTPIPGSISFPYVVSPSTPLAGQPHNRLPWLLSREFTIEGTRSRGYTSTQYAGVAPLPRPGEENVVRYPPIVVVPPIDGIITYPGSVLSVPRAVAIAPTREVKLRQTTRAGRAFMAMYAAFNALGDMYGFTRALWKAIPRAQRGRSHRIGSMASDIFDYWSSLGTASPADRNNYFLRAGLNTFVWKAQDLAYGTAQQGVFTAQAERYGAEAARTWSTVDSAIRQSQGALQRAANRRQTDARW